MSIYNLTIFNTNSNDLYMSMIYIYKLISFMASQKIVTSLSDYLLYSVIFNIVCVVFIIVMIVKFKKSLLSAVDENRAGSPGCFSLEFLNQLPTVVIVLNRPGQGYQNSVFF